MRISSFIIILAALLVLIASLFAFNMQKTNSTNTLNLGSLTLNQKIAQMIITYEREDNREMLQKMFIGGIFIGVKSSKEDFANTINDFQNGTTIPFFVAADMEGCRNPFENFQKFPAFNKIKTEEEAYKVGYEEGKLLKELGFNMNFAPVVDLNDTVWNCRAFIGTPEEISEKAEAYIKGLQLNGIRAVVKHYPGKTMSLKDSHNNIIYATIDEGDLLPFKEAIRNNISAIMVSHVIVNGSVDSESKPSVASEKLVGSLRNKYNFTGLIITDEITMLGFKSYYSNADQKYVDLFKADNDLIVDFDSDPENLRRMISVVENAVKNGEISEKKINNSVIRILKAKGINIK